MQNPDLVQVDPHQLKSVWELYRNHPTVASCVQAISNFVFANGITFKTQLPRLVERSYHRTGVSALEWLLCVGIVPVVFQSLPGYDKLVPIVPVVEAVELFVRLNASGERVYDAVFKRDFKILSHFASFDSDGKGADSGVTKVVVWNGGNAAPTCDGRLVTPMTHLQTSEEFVNFIKRRYMVAEQIRSNPPIVSQSRKKQNNDNEGVAWGIDQATLKLADSHEVGRLEERAMQQYTMHTDWGKSTVPQGHREAEAFLEETRPHEYFVAEERDTTRIDTSAPNSHLPELIRWSEEKIYQIFGLPFGMFSNTGVNLQSNKMQEFSMNQNINRYRSTVQRFLNDVYKLTDNLASCASQLPLERAAPLRGRGAADRGSLGKKRPSSQQTKGDKPTAKKPKPAGDGRQATTQLANAADAVKSTADDKAGSRAVPCSDDVDILVEDDSLRDADFESLEEFGKTHNDTEEDSLVLIPAPLVAATDIQQLLEQEMLTREEATSIVRASLGLAKAQTAATRQKA